MDLARVCVLERPKLPLQMSRARRQARAGQGRRLHRVVTGLRSVTAYVTLFWVAIKSFRHKGLEQFFAAGTKRGIQAKHGDLMGTAYV